MASVILIKTNAITPVDDHIMATASSVAEKIIKNISK